MTASQPSLRIAIAGASGLLGVALASRLESEGHTVLRLSRSKGTGVFWDPKQGEFDHSTLEGVDAVVNFAGRNLASARWTQAVKRDLIESRVLSTRFLASSIATLKTPPRVMISASAIGYYPSSISAIYDESSAPGTNFLSKLCQEWEEAVHPASEAGIRVATLRLGVVLTKKGGMLAKILPIFRLGLGGPIGGGSQWLSWIALPDLLSLILIAITDESFIGPINVVTDSPVTNREFTTQLAHAIHRPAILPVPEFAVSLLFGEMGRQTVLASQNVTPKRLKELNFHWQHPRLCGFFSSEVG